MAKELSDKKTSELINDITEAREKSRGQRFDVTGTKAKDVRAQRKARRETARLLTELSKRSKQ